MFPLSLSFTAPLPNLLSKSYEGMIVQQCNMVHDVDDDLTSVVHMEISVVFYKKQQH